MSKLLVVFGATGQQGGSVVSYVAKELSDQYKIRGITRNPNNHAATKLKALGVEVVKGDTNDKDSLKKALEGAHTVFAMSSLDLNGKGDEFVAGKSIADASVESGAEYIIWSTLVPAKKISNGELSNIEHFDKKAEVEDYIRGLPIKSSFFAPGIFMQNFHSMLKPQPVGDGYSIFNIMNPKTTLPWIDIVEDTGKFVGTILASPDKFEGKTLYSASGHYSFEDMAKIISHQANKPVSYTKIPEETFRSFLPPAIEDDMTEMFKFHDKYGYFGPETKDRVSKTLEAISFKPNSPEKYFESNPLFE